MRRWPLILCLALIAAFLISLTGCIPAPDPTQPDTAPTGPSAPATTPSSIPDPTGDPIDQTTNPTEPMPEIAEIRQLASSIYVTNIYASDGRLGSPTAGDLELTLTRYADGQEAVSMDMTYIEDLFYREPNFQDPRNSFSMQRIDPELSIYYVDATVHLSEDNGSHYFDFFIDLDKEWLLIRPNMVPAFSYTVASADPADNPYDILAYFLPYLEAHFPPWEGLDEPMYPIPERAEQHFCYELTGTWLDADGQVAERMDFRLVGNLTDKVYMNDDLERNLLFLWPEGFGYENAEPVSESITLTVQEAGPNYHGVGLLRDTKTDELVTYWFNIFPEDETVVIGMDGRWLVSSTRSDADAAAILSQYQDRLMGYNAQAVNWEMTAYMLKSDGSVIDTDTMTVTGYIWDYNERYSYLVLDIVFPEGFRYRNSIPGPYGEIGYRILTDDSNDFIAPSVVYDGVLNRPVNSNMCFNTEKEYFVGNWENGNVRYLVACTDPNVPAEEILAHFWGYLERNGYAD